MKLEPVTLYEFECGEMRGYLRGGGSAPGIEITAAGEGRALTPAGGGLFRLSHYLSDVTVGPEAALEAPGRSEELCGQLLSVRFPPSAQWPVDALVDFTLIEEGAIDIEFTFSFRQGIGSFEAQVVSAFAEGIPAAYVHVGGEWFRPALRAKEICFFSRDEPAAAIIQSGRWDFYLERGYNVILDDRGYDYPLLVHQDDKSGWALVQMMITDECPALSICSAPMQHNFSLVGRGAGAGEEITCHARLIYSQFGGLDSILPVYHKFVREVRGGQFAAARRG